MSRTTLYGFLAPCQSLEKTKDTIPRKRADRQKDKRMETYFTGSFQLPYSRKWLRIILECVVSFQIQTLLRQGLATQHRYYLTANHPQTRFFQMEQLLPF